MGCGEGRNRTADAEIFSLSLYRLSYLAVFLDASSKSLISIISNLSNVNYKVDFVNATRKCPVFCHAKMSGFNIGQTCSYNGIYSMDDRVVVYTFPKSLCSFDPSSFDIQKNSVHFKLIEFDHHQKKLI